MSDVVRVMVVDDSRLDQELLRRLLEQGGGVEVVASVSGAREALDRLEEVDPDLILTDLVMPGMGGRELVEEVMVRSPRPILVVTASYDDAKVFRMLEAGALDVVRKPAPQDEGGRRQAAEDLARKVRILSDVTVFTRRGASSGTPEDQEPDEITGDGRGIVVVGASTGGPQALQELLGNVSPSFPLPILCVQHISEGFTQGFTEWLDGVVDVDVRRTVDGATPEPGTVTLPQPDRHLRLTNRGAIRCTDEPEIDGHRPSITATMESAAEVHGSDTVGVLLTGMGADGAQGLAAIRKAGGTTIAQDEATSVVYGMPARAVERGVVDHVLPLGRIADKLHQVARRRTR